MENSSNKLIPASTVLVIRDGVDDIEVFMVVRHHQIDFASGALVFPGGKVDENESFESALKREIQEELNIEINIYKKIAEETYKDEKIDIILHYYLCSQKKGTIKLSEHENLAWVEKKDFEKYDFAEGDGNILSLL